jgi:hypothetical protein
MVWTVESAASERERPFLSKEMGCDAAHQRLGSAAASLAQPARARLAYSSIPVEQSTVADGARWRASMTRPAASTRVVDAASREP